MTWRSFMGFMQMRLHGNPDAICRNYDLRNLNGTKPGMMIDRAAKRMGLAQYNTVRAHLLPLIGQMMRNEGLEPPADQEEFAHLVREWYIWDRIQKMELMQWPLKLATLL